MPLPAAPPADAPPAADAPPPFELTGSPAADRVAAHARASSLFFSHFEHHLHLEGPDAWRPARADLGAPAGWRAGSLREAKFRHFRLDRMVASFHPSHGPRWSVHELCHRLVGWAWAPGADPLWIATAARLAELVPVALWYFHDLGHPRCARHALADPRFDARCPRCEAAEAAAARGEPLPPGVERPDPSTLDRLREEGDRFVAREIEAARRTLRTGDYVAHRYATLELGTDGLAWAAAHGPRLASPTFAAWVERFVPEGTGRHATIEALEARALAVYAALRDDAPLAPWRADRARWVAQDVGWRLAVIQADCEPEAAASIDGLLDDLAASLDVAAAAAGWAALCEDWELPPVEDVFAVGYALGGGLGRSAAQLRDGIASACPGALALLGETADAAVAAFTAADPWERTPLGHRFARLLAAAGPDLPADAVELAALEAAVTHAPAMDPLVAALRDAPDPGGPVRLAPGVAVIRAARDWRPWLGKPRRRRPELPPPAPTHLAVAREPDGDVTLWELDDAAAAVGDTPVEPAVAPETRAALLAAGVWVHASR